MTQGADDACHTIPLRVDPIADSEGSVDPLGLAVVYERLADLMLPGLTVRMRRPRLLTAIAVGARICRECGADEVAKDAVTPPYLVYEWWIIQAFVAASEQLKNITGIPGFVKTSRAWRAGRPLSAAAYLKTASVFGFTGILRRLAVRAQIITEGHQLDEAGHRLVKMWADARHLDGFYQGSSGPGAQFCADLTKAVREGLRDGRTGDRPGSFYRQIATHLDPLRAGPRESALLLELIENRSGLPEEVRFLTGALKRRQHALELADEPAFMRRLTRNAPPRLKETLTAIGTYESFCKPLTDAFDWLRYLGSTHGKTGITASEYTKEAPIKELHASLRSGIDAAAADELLGKNEIWPDRALTLLRLRECKKPQDLLQFVLEHHREAQRQKPPDGKRAWIEDARGRILVRAAYVLDAAPDPRRAYTHDYRLPTLSRFLEDLGALA